MSVPTLSKVTNLQRWKRAVVHLEGAADSVPMNERIERMRAIAERLRSPGAPDDLVLGDPPGRDLRFRGTAVFVKDNDACYLLTARHVLTDRDAAVRDYEGTMPEWVQEREGVEEREERISRWIFPIIFRVPGLDELLARDEVDSAAFLMNLQAGVAWMTPYTFSSPDTDLAIISLRQERRFTEDLVNAGYEPISLADLADGPSQEAVDVVSVGYPESTAVLGQQTLHPAVAHWASSAISLPVLSFGRVAMSHPALAFFWADISIYPGNSGGPVIERDKLVGIVSSQATVEGTRIPFARVIRAEHVRALVSEQRTKDAERGS